MLDFILGLVLAAMLVRGWLRGLIREVLDLVGLVAGLWIAFRVSPILGDFLVERFAVAPEVARIGAGIVLFVLFGVSLSIAGHYLTRMLKLPGLSIINRVGGSLVAVAWGAALVLVAINLARVLPLPEIWEMELRDSTVVEAIAGPDALPQRLLERFLGDDVLVALGTIQEIFGSGRVVPEGLEAVEIPPAAPDEIRQVRDEAEVVIREVNEIRAGRGLRALQTSAALTEVAEERATRMYTTGRLSRETPPGVFVGDDLLQAGIRVVVSGEAIALAGSALGGLAGIVDSHSGDVELSNGSYDRVGVSVLAGPTGRLLVVVFAG